VPLKVSEALTTFPFCVALAACFDASRQPTWLFFLLGLSPKGLGAYLGQLLGGDVAGVIACCSARQLESHLGSRGKAMGHLSKVKM